MIPIRLELRNFLPYRNPDPIYFEGVHLACLTGQNGAGKSSLLDAIVWALWGKSRAKRDEELIHLNQAEMYVQLDFEQEGINYRVYRRRTRSRRGAGTLDLFVLQDDGELLTLNEPSMRQTQYKIEDILKLDYDTFINSAFLQQGKADAFTIKTPAERKKILSDILGLDAWAKYEDTVKDKLKRLETDLSVYALRMQEIDDELAKEPQYKIDLKNAEQAHQDAQEALARAQEALDEVAHAPKERDQKKDQLTSHETRLSKHQTDLESVERAIARHTESVQEYEAVVAQQEDIEAGYATLQDARSAQTELAEQLQQLTDLNNEFNDLEKQLAQAQADLEKEKGEYTATISELERQIEQNTSDDLEAVQRDLAELEDLDRQRDDLYEQISNLKAEKSGLSSRLETLKTEGLTLNERLDKLETVDGATCPLCGQALTPEHREDLLAQITTERDTKREDYRQHNARTLDIEQAVKTKTEQMDAMALQLKRLAPVRERMGALQTQQEQALDAQTRLDEAKADLQKVVSTLDDESYAQAIREQLTEVESKRQAIGYDADSHDDTTSKLETYSDYEVRNTQLQVALESLPKAQENLKDSQKRYDNLCESIEEEQTAIDALKTEIESLDVLVKEEQKRRNEKNQQHTNAQVAQERLSEAKQQLKALDSQRKRRAELEDKRQATLEEETLYKELRLAFGKNGVPAMIIETVIPELEAEANRLLAKMTEGRMHLRLTTQREKVTGGVAETLDIEIADELGTRGYEMYSGGEAFRINFAIRVALSKMLARRAGAHLRTLFIDEGFGSQDSDGRNKLVEAITTIQHDFDLILVITHIDELKDSFPVHVVVDKTQNGSRVLMR